MATNAAQVEQSQRNDPLIVERLRPMLRLPQKARNSNLF